LTIRLVEDHADRRNALRLTLQSVGARVRVARDGLTRWRRWRRGPDIVLAYYANVRDGRV
jgi:CheY-like chemotaxis protein